MDLKWDKGHLFEDACSDMIYELKEDGLPIVAWGDTTEELFVPFFKNNGIVIDSVCDKDKEKYERNGGGV